MNVVEGYEKLYEPNPAGDDNVRGPTCRMWSSELRSGVGLEQIRLTEVSSPLLRRKVIRHNMNALPKRNPRTEAPEPGAGVKKTHPLEEITTLG